VSTIFVDLIFVPESAARKLIPGRKRHQGWRWVAKNADNRKVLARSSERYTNASDARMAIDQLFGPNTNVYLREPEHGNVPLRMAQ
jgi:hypothetical protein